MKILYFFGFLVFAHFTLPTACSSDPKCTNVTCTQPLECRYPKVTVELPDPYNKCCNITECICEGTAHRLSASHDPEIQYKTTLRYTNCTMIDGNLEIVYIHPKGDVLEATKHIRVVTGYVLIALNYIHYIDLSSLRLIRGDKLYHSMRTKSQTCGKPNKVTSRGSALFITNNYQQNDPSLGLRGIRMPSLTEIMKGDVNIHDNRDLCFVNTIIWEGEILNSHQQKANVSLSRNATTYCPQCPSSCVNTKVDTNMHCWGDTPDLCQQFTSLPCKGTCDNRCNSRGGCCSSDCAAGCIVEDDSRGVMRECYACKMLNNFGKCVAQCPSKASGTSEVPVIDVSKIRYELTWYCVPKCPSTRRVFENEKCVFTCPDNYHDVDGVCKECPSGGCSNICLGLGVPGPLYNDDVIHSMNIGNFSKNCTIIEGSLNFRLSTFEGDSHCEIPAIKDKSAFDVFENVEEITGFLGIEHWPYADLCIFKNLKRIRGSEVRYMTYSLLVITDADDLRELCFNSLEEIQAGTTRIKNNKRLCFTEQVNWDLFMTPDQIRIVSENMPQNKCAPCSEDCLETDGCWGPKSDQCVTCRAFTDYTNVNGKFATEWVEDPATKLSVPGHNVTNCVPTCNLTKGVYPTADRKCYPCDLQCELTCNGPGPTRCFASGSAVQWGHGCKNVNHNGTCVPECPETHYANGSRICLPCSLGCIGGCDGPQDGYGQDGCRSCHMRFDEDTSEYIYRGAQCQTCLDNVKDSECHLGCIYSNTKGVYRCYEEPSSVYIVWIVVVCLIVGLGGTIGVILFKCRKTIRSMQKHIGEKIVGDGAQPDDFDTPITPSGTAPNQAKLRMVKDDELTSGKTLGSGAFGTVFKAVWNYPHIEGQTIKISVAVKKLNTFSHSNEITDEAYVMAAVDNPYLIRLLGICMKEQVSLITQFMPLGNLLEYVRGNPDNIGSRHMLTWCIQIAKGMQYLEDKHLVHRDLAARNVLVKTPHHVKITDFGLAKMLNADQSFYFAEGGKLPIKWLAIECITERQFSHLSDVWAFGVTCWEIFTFGARPYDGVRAIDVLSLLERGERLNQPPVCTIEVYMILIKCWMVDPLSRPKFSELVDEFSVMLHDHARYIVIKDDPNPGMMSPNPEEERRFFERLIKEDVGNIDGDLMVGEPDTYLLPGSREPEYENQSALERQQGTAAVNSGASSSRNGAAPRSDRLFSRNTPSAHPTTPPAGYNRAVDPLASGSTGGPSRVSDSSNPDDVFAMSGHRLREGSIPPKSMTVDLPSPEKAVDGGAVRYRPSQAGGPWPSAIRKDSEENPRYTDDPTAHKNYFDPGKACPTKERMQETTPKVHHSDQGVHQGSLLNNTYVDSGEVSPLLKDYSVTTDTKKSNVNERKELSLVPEYVNTQQQPEYLNCVPGEPYATSSDRKSVPDRVSRSFSAAARHDVTFYNNEEYMTTDSGIGEDNQSVLSASNGLQTQIPKNTKQTAPSRNRQNSSLSSGGSSSSGSLGPLIGGSPVRRQRLSSDEQQMDLDHSTVQYKPVPKPRQSVKKSRKSSPPNLNVGLDNPEYMMLQESTSDTKDQRALLAGGSSNT